MEIPQMREMISNVYSSDTWRWKVERMPDHQVLAIYFDFLARGMFDKKQTKPKPKKESPTNKEAPLSFTPYIGEQLSFDL